MRTSLVIRPHSLTNCTPYPAENPRKHLSRYPAAVLLVNETSTHYLATVLVTWPIPLPDNETFRHSARRFTRPECSDSQPWCRSTQGCRKKVPGVTPYFELTVLLLVFYWLGCLRKNTFSRLNFGDTF